MHGVSVHSALAIKRQRKRRDEAARRGKRRGQNKPISEANLGGGSNTANNKVIGTVTTLHVGIVFSLIGFLFLVSALIPSSTATRKEYLNLIATGVSCLAIGAFLICINRFYGNKEDQELSNYVETQLARTTSGQRLVRDQSEINVRSARNSKAPSIRGARGSASGSGTSVGQCASNNSGVVVNTMDSPVIIDIQDCSTNLDPIVEEQNRNKDTYRVYDKDRVESF